MSLCDMCGSKEAMFVADVEGSLLNVCNSCKSYGKVKSMVKAEQSKIKKKEAAQKKTELEKEIIQLIVSDFAKRIRDKREKLKLNQEDFAKKISEKESLVHKLEVGEFEPSIQLARKLEKFLGISLIEQHHEVKSTTPKVKSDTFTIGDFIKIKE